MEDKRRVILYAKDRSGADLSRVQVAMKLSVLSGDRIEEIVPKISRLQIRKIKSARRTFFRASFPSKIRTDLEASDGAPKPAFFRFKVVL